jgi:phenylalanyl-tRNA synthetase alpha chain
VEKAPTELTPEMLASGSWRTTQLRPYNLEALGLEPPAGCLHPLLKVLYFSHFKYGIS